MQRENLFETVQDNARRQLSWRKAKTSNLFIQNEVLSKGHVIQARHQQIPLEQDTIMVFADDAPGYNWSHKCRYLLHNADDGKLYKEVAAAFPPYLIHEPETYQVFHEPVHSAQVGLLWQVRPELRFAWKYPPSFGFWQS